MSRVELRAGDRAVVVEHDGDLTEASTTALVLWRAIAPAADERRSAPAMGFQAERAWTPPARPSGMRTAPYPVHAIGGPR